MMVVGEGIWSKGKGVAREKKSDMISFRERQERNSREGDERRSENDKEKLHKRPCHIGVYVKGMEKKVVNETLLFYFFMDNQLQTL